MNLQKPAGHQYLTHKITTFTNWGLLTKQQITIGLLVNFWLKKTFQVIQCQVLQLLLQ
jgi:hypothetical protein